MSWLGDLLENVPVVGTLLRERREGQARDEARQVRATDTERDQQNFEKQLYQQSLSGRIEEGRKHGLSAMASIGAMPGGGAVSSPVGQDTSYNQMGVDIPHTSALEKKQIQMLDAQIEHQKLQNAKLGQELNQKPVGTAPVGLGFMPGGSTGVNIKDIPMERTASMSGRPGAEPGAINSLGWAAGDIPGRTILDPIPSKDIKERIEDSPYELDHYLTYKVMPMFGGSAGKPPSSALPFGKNEWIFSKRYRSWVAINTNDARTHTEQIERDIEAFLRSYKFSRKDEAFSYRDSTGKFHKTKIPSWKWRR